MRGKSEGYKYADRPITLQEVWASYNSDLFKNCLQTEGDFFELLRLGANEPRRDVRRFVVQADSTPYQYFCKKDPEAAQRGLLSFIKQGVTEPPCSHELYLHRLYFVSMVLDQYMAGNNSGLQPDPAVVLAYFDQCEAIRPHDMRKNNQNGAKASGHNLGFYCVNAAFKTANTVMNDRQGKMDQAPYQNVRDKATSFIDQAMKSKDAFVTSQMITFACNHANKEWFRDSARKMFASTPHRLKIDFIENPTIHPALTEMGSKRWRQLYLSPESVAHVMAKVPAERWLSSDIR